MSSSTLSAISPSPTCSTNSISQIPPSIQAGPYCAVASQIGSNNETNNATAAMEACCGTAPIIIVKDSCDIYCSAINQTTDQLLQCLGQQFGANKGNTAGVLCNRNAAAAVKPQRVVKVIVATVVLWGICSLAELAL